MVPCIASVRDFVLCCGIPGGRPALSCHEMMESVEQHPAVCWLQGLGLCHGISGNTYALAAAARASGGQHARQEALQSGIFMAEHWEKLYPLSDRP